MNPLIELQKQGQSVWLDFITRQLINGGELDKLISDDGVRGMTSNPTLFQKALSSGTDYDPIVLRHLDAGRSSADTFEAIQIEDVRRACDSFRAVYENTNGTDGFVSIEVNPNLAKDAEESVEEAARLFHNMNRPNVMIKIPATEAGIPAIRQSISDGININITLIFSLERYEQVIEAWLEGLKIYSDRGGDLRRIVSVASFFVSRVDTLVDDLLQKKVRQAPAQATDIEALMGKAGVANAKLAYAIFKKMEVGPRFKALEEHGAQVQRPLWASTGTKNPRYSDVMYVEELIGPHTVNTLTMETLRAFREHGRARETVNDNLEEATGVWDRLEKLGISRVDVGRQLEEAGVESFVRSYNDAVKSINLKRRATFA